MFYFGIISVYIKQLYTEMEEVFRKMKIKTA